MSDSTSPVVCSPSSSSSSSVESCGILEAGPDLTRSPLLSPRLLRLQACRSHLGPIKSRRRGVTPPDKKDAAYWDKRRKNNEAAKRSREKRRFKELLLEDQLVVLSEENVQLRAQILHMLEKCAPPCAASPASAASHSPAFLQAGLWAPIRTNSPTAMRQQEAATLPFEATVPGLRSTRGVFNPLSQHLPQPDPVSFSGPCVLHHGGVLGARRPEEVEMDAQRRVSSSNDIPTPAAPQILSSMSFLPTVHASAAPQHCVMPHLNPAAMLPWPHAYLAKPSIYSRLPVHARGRAWRSPSRWDSAPRPEDQFDCETN